MKELNRRDFLLRVTAVGALASGTGTLLSACGGGETTPAPMPEPEAAAPVTGCDDLTGLTDQEKQMRTQLQYVAETPDPAKNCLNCALWVPVPEGASCGGCNLIKGPIAPEGYCISWAPKAT